MRSALPRERIYQVLLGARLSLAWSTSRRSRQRSQGPLSGSSTILWAQYRGTSRGPEQGLRRGVPAWEGREAKPAGRLAPRSFWPARTAGRRLFFLIIRRPP